MDCINIDGIRNAFSKAFIITGDDFVTVLYNFKDRWFTQSLENDDKEVLEKLLNGSDRVILQGKPDKYIRIVFYGKFAGIHGNTIYNPISPEVTTAELEDIVNNMEIKDPYNMMEIFSDIDLDDDDVIDDGLRELLKRSEESIETTISFRSIHKWNKIREISELLPFSESYIKIAEPPDEISGGYLEYQFHEATDKPICISGNKKEIVSELVRASIDISIEGDVVNGIYDITVFA